MIKFLFFIILILGDSFSLQQKDDIEGWNLKIEDSKKMLSDYESQNDEINASTQRTFLSYSYSWLWFRYGDLESLKDLIIQNVQTLDKEVLSKIKRRNFPIDQLKYSQDELDVSGKLSQPEIILGLPYETKESHLNTFRKIINEICDAASKLFIPNQRLNIANVSVSTAK